MRNKKKEYLKAEIDELETNTKMKNIRDLCRDINDFKKGYQPRTNIVKDEKVDLLIDSHGILARWRKHFSQLFNVHGVRNVCMHTAEPPVPGLSAFEVEMATEKLKGLKSQQNWLRQGGRTICSGIHKLFTSIWNKGELPEDWRELIIVPIYKKGDKTVCIIYRGITLFLTMYRKNRTL